MTVAENVHSSLLSALLVSLFCVNCYTGSTFALGFSAKTEGFRRAVICAFFVRFAYGLCAEPNVGSLLPHSFSLQTRSFCCDEVVKPDLLKMSTAVSVAVPCTSRNFSFPESSRKRRFPCAAFVNIPRPGDCPTKGSNAFKGREEKDKSLER